MSLTRVCLPFVLALLAMFASPSPLLATTTNVLSVPPVNYGFVPTGWNWSAMSGAISGLSLTATTTLSFDRLTMHECALGGLQGEIAHVYVGPMDALIEVATSSYNPVTSYCPPNIFQDTGRLTLPESERLYSFPRPIDIPMGATLTILFEPESLPSNPGGVAHAITAESGVDSLFVGKVGPASVALSPYASPGVSYRPAFSLSLSIPDGCTVNCYSNVLFLPGIESSRLYRPDYQGGTDQLWEPNAPSDVEDLYLDENGESIRDDVYTEDVIDEANVLLMPRPNIYLSFLSDLKKWKDDEGLIADYAVAPYDWRLSMDDVLEKGNELADGRIYYSGTNGGTTSPYIVTKLRSLAATSRTGKVTIIAHSNGGLVAKALIEKLGTDADDLIDKVVLVAVPQLGTPQALGALLHGYDQGLPNDRLPTFLDPATARAFASTSPMAYHLLPSGAYFRSGGVETVTPMVTFEGGSSTDPFISRYGHAIGNYSELDSFLRGEEGRPAPSFEDVVSPGVLRSGLLDYARNLHSVIDDSWTPPSSIRFVQIAGFGNETVSGIRYWTGIECKSSSAQGRCISPSPKLEYTPEFVVDGDGTVITTSALAMSTSSENVTRWWVDLDKYNSSILSGSLFRTDVKHAGILEIPELREYIRDYVISNNSQTISYEYVWTTAPTVNNGKRLQFFLHSPLNLIVEDNQGGIVSEATTTITGASFVRFGEVQSISIPASKLSKLRMVGIEDGTFSLEIRETNNGEIAASTTFIGVPSSMRTNVEMDFTDGTIAGASPLRIDYDGDGQIESSLTPVIGGSVRLPFLDSTPPISSAATVGEQGKNGWYLSDALLTLTATDTESGVASTSYSLDGITWSDYTAPFSVTEEGTTTVSFFSIDDAGNREATNTLIIKIDKTAPEASISISTSTRDLLVTGVDDSGPVAVNKESATTTLLTDHAGHTTKLFFSKTYSGKILTSAQLTAIEYDGSPKRSVPASTFVYLWDTRTNPSLLVSQTILANNAYLVQALYDKQKNKTTIVVLKKNVPVQTLSYPGLRLIRLTTEKGVVGYGW